jgi:hypothetical protein
MVQLATKAGLRPRCCGEPQGLGISLNLLLSYTYRQGNRWSVPLSLICNYKLLGVATQ